MYQKRERKTPLGGALAMAGLVYHGIVRDVRKSHNNAIVALFLNIVQTLILVLVFYVMFSLLGLRGSAIRGDFLLYIMSGVFLFMCHIKGMSGVIGSEGPTSPMMKHATMNTLVAISSAALSALYIQMLSMGIVLFGAHVAIAPIEIDDPVGLMTQVVLAWLSGVCIGLVFLALKPWVPSFVSVSSMIYMRANMIASGKMFVANNLPGHILPFFMWNPLFHTIDQARGATFINYNPHFTSPTYALTISLIFFALGMMGEFFTRKRASISWDARR